MLSLRLCAWLLVAFGSLGVWAEEVKTVTRGPAPRWVIGHPVDLAASDDAAKEQGESSHFLLRDAQRHLEEATEYRHLAFRPLNQAGLQNSSTLTFEFDPAYERLEFHQLVVHRKGERIDRLPQQEIKVFQRETNLEQQLYDGRLTASIILDDVRIGDVIEYAYSRRGVNPIYRGHLVGSVNIERVRPLHQMRERLLCSTRRPQPQFQGHATDVQAHVQQGPGDLMEYRWDADDQPGQLSEGDVPSWIDTLGWVQFSDFKTWGEVAQWAAALFAPAVPAAGEALPEELEKEAAALEELPAGGARIAAALRYVQDNFRYLGIEIGENTHQPYPVAKVCARRFGDCKDKANLLSVLLRRLGYQADPALVATDYRHTIAGWLPTPMAFDHAIVRVVWNGRAYWLDPTQEHQGGTLDHIYLPAYGKALVVNAATRDLEDVAPGGHEESAVEIVHTFRQTSDQEPAILHVRTTYRGDEADEMRETRATTSAREIERDFLNYYTGRYAKAEVRQAARFHDDLEKNELVVDEEYRIPDAWVPSVNRPGKLQVSVFTGTLPERLTEPATHRRTLPFAVDFPCHITEQFEVDLVERTRIEPNHMEVVDPAFRFVFDSKVDAKGMVQLRYEYTVLAAEVAAERTAEYSANLKRVREVLRYTIFRTDPGAPAAALSQAVAASPVVRVARRSMALAFLVGLVAMLALAGFTIAHWARARRQLQRPQREPGPALHECTICHRTDVSHPDLEFRVGGDGRDYCVDHLRRPAVSPAR